MTSHHLSHFDHSHRWKVEALCPTRPLYRPPLRRVIGRALSIPAAATFIAYVMLGFCGLL